MKTSFRSRAPKRRHLPERVRRTQEYCRILGLLAHYKEAAGEPCSEEVCQTPGMGWQIPAGGPVASPKLSVKQCSLEDSLVARQANNSARESILLRNIGGLKHLKVGPITPKGLSSCRNDSTSNDPSVRPDSADILTDKEWTALPFHNSIKYSKIIMKNLAKLANTAYPLAPDGKHGL
ncbi:unnamed protein product [Protopolystoma xenopodis]|uniref:Uncharacterized protein n=1 Tax=Protopolystoma xenopodis TaxID=117903 RepID=A0A448XG27_9PLAT|nr:unnamed protein product [Protopolystoma xenopodis]